MLLLKADGSIDIWVAIIGSLGGIVSLVLGYFLKYLFDKKQYSDKKEKKSTESLEKDLSFYSDVNSMLDSILEESNADRIVIYEFHNGGHYYHNNRPMQKFSASFEAKSPGISSILELRKDVYVISYVSIFKELFENGHYSYSDVSMIKEESIRETYEKQIGTQSICSIPLKNRFGKYIGFVTFHYIKKKEELNKEKLEILKEKSIYISGYIDRSYKNSR